MLFNVTLGWKFLGTMSSTADSFGHYLLRIYNKHEILFDTGSDRVWLVSNIARPATGFSTTQNAVPCTEVVTYGVEGMLNTFSGTKCLSANFWVAQKGVKWNTDIALSDTPVSWWQWDGVLGSSLNSDFVRKFPIFRIVPTRHKSKYNLFVAQTYLRKKRAGCMMVPLTAEGIQTNRWIVKGLVRAGNSAWTESDFAVDTGFPSIALRHDVWEVLKAQLVATGAIVTGAVEGSYGQVIENCQLSSIPSVEYLIGTFRMRIPPSGFAIQQNGEKCLIYAILHGGMSFIGVSFLKRINITFNSINKYIELCK